MRTTDDVRALILAIEEYPNAQDVSRKLAGTTQAAREFIRWIREAKGVPMHNIWLCGESAQDDSSQIRHFGTTRSQVRQAIVSLCDAGRNQTKQLFVFVSGHGYAYQAANEASLPAEIFVCSDFIDSKMGGDACVNIAELQQKLAHWLGGVDHFYFVDCCRNLMPHSRIDPATLALYLAPTETGRPFIYTLYSTAMGASASTRSRFVEHLLDALRGKGRAKGYTDDNRHMQVVFPLVSDYLKKRLGPQEIESRPGGGDGIILTPLEVPENTCSLRIQGASESDEFNAQLLLRDKHVGDPAVFHGPMGSIRANPEVYTIKISHRGGAIAQIAPPAGAPLDMYESCEAEFAVVSKQRGETIPAPKTYIELNLPPNTSVSLRDLNRGQTHRFSGNVRTELDAGSYELRAFEGELVIAIQHLTIIPGITNRPNLLGFTRSPARMSILRATGSDPETRTFSLFRNRGPIADIDIALWLSILASSTLLDSNQQDSSFAHVPLPSFHRTEPGAAVLQIVSAFYRPPHQFMVGIHLDGEVSWHRGSDIEGLQNVCEVTVPIQQPGPYLVSFRLDDAPITTFVTQLVENAVTLVILAPLADEELGKYNSTWGLRNQYILPIGRRTQARALLSLNVQLQNDPTVIRDMFYIQKRFCSGRVVTSASEADAIATWQEVLTGKWLDPISVAILCYERIRRGKLRESQDEIRYLAESLWRNCRLPDANVILMMLGEQRDSVGLPLLLDGLLSLSGRPDLLPYTASRLDYRGGWTMWKDVVNQTE